MLLKKPSDEIRAKMLSGRVEMCLGCPMDRHRATWCRGLCTPRHGIGPCGRLAPHALRGRTQRAIARAKQHATVA